MSEDNNKSAPISLNKVGSILLRQISIKDGTDVAHVFSYLKNSDREKFIVLSLDDKSNVIGTELVAIGALDQAIIHPREVYKVPVYLNAKNIICIHNHPSGDSTPSPQDKVLTKNLLKTGELLGIKLLDHIVIGNEYYHCIDAETGYTSKHNYYKSNDNARYNVDQYEVVQIDRPKDFKVKILSHYDAATFANKYFKKDKDTVVACFLNAKKEVISFQLFDSNLDNLDLQELARKSVLCNSNSVILCSNNDFKKNETLDYLKYTYDTLGINLDDVVISNENEIKSYFGGSKHKDKYIISDNKSLYDSKSKIDKKPKRYLFCGSRDFIDEIPINDMLKTLEKDSIVIHGGAPGADTIADNLARKRGLNVVSFNANWNKYGKAAGPIRNQQMIEQNPDAVFAFYTDKENSKGTADTVERAKKAGIYVYEYDQKTELMNLDPEVFEFNDNIKLFTSGHNFSSPIHYKEEFLKAKAGSEKDIDFIITKAVNNKYLENMKNTLGDTSDIVFVPILEKGDNANTLPSEISYKLASEIGGEVEKILVYQTDVKRKELGYLGRMRHHRHYEASDPDRFKNKRIVLVDDHFTTGGTIRDAYLQLKNVHGLNVVGVATVSASREKKYFMVGSSTLKKLQDKYRNDYEVDMIENHANLKMKHLTQAEANFMLNIVDKEKLFTNMRNAANAVDKMLEENGHYEVRENKVEYKAKEITEIVIKTSEKREKLDLDYTP